MTKLTEELIANIKKLRNEGKTYQKIADMLGVSKTSAVKYGKETVKGIPTIKKVVAKETKPIKVKPKKVKLSRKERKALKKALKK